MANETITFFCPACGIKLTVPAGLAGVTGPCPSCRTQIQAPATGLPPQASVQDQGYATPAALPQPMSQLAAQAPIASEPTIPSTLKPEPRQLPNRPHPSEVVAKQMPERTATGDSRISPPAPLAKHPHKPALLTRFLTLLLFLIASGALVFGVLTVLKVQPEKQFREKQAPPQSPEPAHPVKEFPAPEPVKAPEKPKSPALPTPPPEQPTLIEPAPKLPEGLPPKPPGMEALEVLEKFLTAKSLAERLPFIETKTPDAEIAASCLAGPLPPTPKMLLEFQESTPLEEVMDFYYSVDFQNADGHTNPQTILVRTRGRGEPKVVVDPFLDLFGGRLATYASKPTDKAGVFQVIASPLASCTNPNVPDREKKLTLKLLARDNTKEIAQAYFGKLSKIGEMLEDGTYSLSYGKAKACTVMLRWNTEEDAKHAYLEAIAIKNLDWNP